jgi:hypothetical protein
MRLGRVLGPLLVALAASAVVLARGDAPPKLDTACATTGDCGFTHMDELCCWVCGVRVGSATWVRATEAFCKSHPGKGCDVPRCGQASVRPACVQGRCTR